MRRGGRSSYPPFTATEDGVMPAGGALGTLPIITTGIGSFGALVSGQGLANQLTVNGSQAGFATHINAVGTDVSIDIDLVPKGAGIVKTLFGFAALTLEAGRGIFNQLTVHGSATGVPTSIAATGGDASIDINLVPKGAGGVRIGTSVAALKILDHASIADAGGTAIPLAGFYDLVLAVPGAAVGDACNVNPPSLPATCAIVGALAGANTVTVRWYNIGAPTNTPAGNYEVSVTR